MMKYPALHDRMKWLGITGKRLAKQLDMPYTTLTQYLNGDRRLPVEVAIRISKALGKSVEELFRYAYVDEEE